jgi:hypothetical protein
VDWEDLARWTHIDKELKFGQPDPTETYSSSEHLFTDLSIPAGTKGRLKASTRVEAPKSPRPQGQKGSRPSRGSDSRPERSGEKKTERPAASANRTRNRTRGGNS